MIEIDHTAVPPPEPATPILASSLLAIEEEQSKRFSGRGDRIRTGCSEIDEYLLRGGCERGIIVGISAEAGEGRLMSLHLLSSILISHLPIPSIPSTAPSQPTKARAIVIDTTGSFPIPLLAKVLKSRLFGSRSKIADRTLDILNHTVGEESVDVKEIDNDVQRCLEIVDISRVFDVEGLWEVLGEVGRDSETGDKDDEEKGYEEGVEMIVIDNMTHLVNEVFARKERSEAHTLLTALSRALHTLTHTHNTLTLLHNTTVSNSNRSHSSEPSTEARYSDPYTPKQPTQNPQRLSIFLSNPLRPALGQIFSQFPDLHLLISALPKTREDAERLYGRDEDVFGGWGRNGQSEVSYCYVIEVLKDETPKRGSQSEQEPSERKFGGREQRWAAVEISSDGLGLVDAFMVKGYMRSLGLEHEKGRVQDVGSVAKIYGLGGRRV